MKGRDDRFYPEATSTAPYRYQAQIDRDRVLYCPHLARLGEVTQVRASDGDFLLHDRLTHSHKVAQVARRTAERLLVEQSPLAATLGLNVDVAEAAGLGHDLGHPPFGHIAEEKLNSLVKEMVGEQAEGYEGNAQSFRIITALGVSDSAASADEEDFQPGLNLTKATLNAILKYPWLYGANPAKKKKWGAYKTEEQFFHWARDNRQDFMRSVEAEIMDWADDITYAIHDMIDFYCAGLIPLHLLASEQGDGGELSKREWANFFEGACKRNEAIGKDRERHEEALRKALFFAPITEPYKGYSSQTRDLWFFSSVLITSYVAAIELIDPDKHDGRSASIKDFATDQTTVLKELTWFYVINRSDLATVQHGQKRIIAGLFEAFSTAIKEDHLEYFPIGFAQLIERDKSNIHAARWTADYLSGLTERQIINLHKRIVGNH